MRIATLASCLAAPEIFLPLLCFLFLSLYAKRKSQPLVQWPIVRNLPCLLLNAHCLNQWLVEVFNSIGRGTVVVKGPIFAGLDYMFTCDPHNIEYITRTNFPNFPKGPDFHEMFSVLGDGIFNADGDSWSTQRKMTHMRFGSKEFRTFYSAVSQEVVQEGLMPLLQHVAEQGSVVDLQDVFLRFTFDSNCTTIFGRNPRYLSIGFPENAFARATDDGTEAIFYRLITPRLWWKTLRLLRIGREKKLFHSLKTADRIIEQYISLKREDLAKANGGPDLLSTYINFEGDEEEKKYLSSKGDNFLRDTTLNFLLAGRDSIGSGLIWFFWLLSKTPSVEAKILEELRVLKQGIKAKEELKQPSVFSLEDLKGLVYLPAALNESMRLYPPVPLEHKGVVTKDVLPDGTPVRPGMMIMYSIYAVGRMNWVWGEDCLEFKPERWIDEKGRLKSESASKYVVFNAGPRTCLGKNMALTQMKLVAAALLFNFQVEVVEGQSVATKPSVVLHMKNGLMVRIKERKE